MRGYGGKYRRIGLLGGSFNPAHGGHLHITLRALRRLGLDEVWWLVSPKNPLKTADSLADYGLRMASAQKVARGVKGVWVTDIEQRLGSRYTYQTVAKLQRLYPQVQFVWLMGADNLAQFHRWKRWRKLAQSLPVVVFDRAPYSHRALHSPAARAMRVNLLKINDLGRVWPQKGLLYLLLGRHPLSSTALRKTLGSAAFAMA